VTADLAAAQRAADYRAAANAAERGDRPAEIAALTGALARLAPLAGGAVLAQALDALHGTDDEPGAWAI
jgi:hypothetical protein